MFANNGNASSPDALSPVVASGVDDIHTSVAGGLSDFYGTSASSASLAGVAALILSANPNLTPAQVEAIMEETALPMTNSAVSGDGLVQVNLAVGAALGPVVSAANTTESLGQTSVAASSFFTAPDPDGGAISTYGFKDSGGGHFVLNGVIEPNNEEIDVTVAQLLRLTYVGTPGAVDTLQIRVEDASTWGQWTASRWRRRS